MLFSALVPLGPRCLLRYFGAPRVPRPRRRFLALTDVSFTEIPLHIKSGSAIPVRNSSAYTTTDVWKQPFVFLVTPDVDGEATRSLYLDNDDSIVQDSTSQIEMVYKNKKIIYTW
jgi:alpha-glucosidase (family GH31 glycosyl hydrolase)